ncbi:hypothetical protein, partial [Leifsonia sp. Leaf264]|uniref:hypothetical protein n=1 Tax=Leifsonia sp. Leaf264 TaxID=1736314 RepID=UPI0019109849
MERSTRRRAVLATAMLAVGSVFALALPTAAWAAAPSFVDPPTRLYMLPNADGPLPASVPFPVVPDGVMTFDGTTDLISLQDRKLEVESAENDCTPGPEFALSGCTAIQFDVGHGTLDFFPAPSAVDDSDSTFDAYVLPSGAIVRDMDSADDLPAKITAIVGTTQQVNEAMQTLRYTPDEDYYYNGSNPETLRVDLIPGDGTLGTVEADVEIRVQDLNDFPEATVPPDLFTVDPGLEVTLGTPDQWEVTDADNDEVTDGEESPGEGDTIDGEGTELLVIAWATCGRIHLQGASGFEIGDDLEELVGSALGFDDPPTVDQQAVIDAFLEIVPDEVESLPFATGNQNEPTAAFAGVADDISWVNYALDEVVFEAVDPTTLAPLGDQTCDVNTLVSDLGNNGLPLNYVGSPPSGVETPFFGFDVDTNEAPGVERVTVKVGEGTEIDVTMPTDATVAEGATDVLPIAITPAVHPAFDLTVSSTPNAPATAGVDYTSLSAVTVPIPENATDASVPVDALQDLDLDPGETYSVTLTPPATPPPGYTVTSSDPSALVTIDDDEVDPGDAVAPTVTLNQGATQVDPTSVSPIVFDVVFSEPVVGFTASDVVLGGTAGATTVVISGAGPAYTVSVSGMTVGGDVFATIPAGAVVDASPNANPSAASTSEDNTVIFTVDPGDVVAPTVTLNQGATQVDPTSVSPIVFDVVFS